MQGYSFADNKRVVFSRMLKKISQMKTKAKEEIVYIILL